MKPARKLSKFFSGGEYPAFCDDERIHVLVVRPEGAVSAGELSLGFVDCKIGFYNDIVNADVKDGWLYFIQTIPSSVAKSKALLVRASYQTIASSIQERGEDGIFKTIITGTPGIGKSLFLIYLLWILVKAGKKVLFIYHPNLIYYDGLGGVFELRELPSAIEHSFWDESLWCLFDAKGKNEGHLSAIPYDSCNVVLSTSPRRDMINDFKKPPVPRVFFMPLWTEPELEQVGPSFPHVLDWHDRFKILGGIPRMVLEDSEQEATKILEAACKQCELDDCIKIIGLDSTITEKSKVVHSLVHITSEAPFTTSSVCYASGVALGIIVRIKGVEAKQKMQQLLQSCEGNPLIASLCGYIFEPYTFDLLEAGGTFKYHELVHGNKKAKPGERDLTIKGSSRIVANKVSNSHISNQLYVPTTKNFTAIDAWIPQVGAFQMTVGKTHDIKGGAEENLKLLGNNGNKLYWLLPPLYYHSFTKKTPQTIKQYAVLIPYPE
ncbi:Aste57867_4226 [Aphanomyces stellatus]|uniref:Aste57867_4226 protein n=1 Tax=Aphanomyces stellatus TaxID=120398 RepID=A0A485KBF3_9STRA|nr:hypothetical protein As57867_004215 [Aphanomyces stellatus]VFT81343.1 Aste57867_4226 [Aphanomyces stellatus]